MNDPQMPVESRSSGPSFDFASPANILCALPGEVSHSFVRVRRHADVASTSHRVHLVFTSSSLRLHFVFTSSSLRLHLTAAAQPERRSNRRFAMTWGIPTHLFLQIH